MLTFDIYPEDLTGRPAERVHVDPACVASVRETERRRAYGGYSPVAVLTMHDGERFVVYDGARAAARQVAEAQRGAGAASQPVGPTAKTPGECR